jgi:hypothetical protein
MYEIPQLSGKIRYGQPGKGLSARGAVSFDSYFEQTINRKDSVISAAKRAGSERPGDTTKWEQRG